jgi:hypothetical protein
MVVLLRKIGRRLIFPWLLLLSILLVAVPAVAQIANSATMIDIELRGFPQLIAYLNIRDMQGDFVPGIQIDRVAVFEDGAPQPLSELRQLNSGVAFTLVINPGATFAIRDAQGFSRYDHLLTAITDWASKQEQGESLDALSLFISSGPEIYDLSNPEEWLDSLLGYQTDFRFAQPGLDSLDRAIDITAGPAARKGMGRAILLITPPLEGDLSLGLQNLASRAKQQGVRICVWMVASPDTFASQAAEQLAQLAYQTGGSFFTFSGVESIPDMEGYLEPLRSIYQLEYDSFINSGGTHEFFVEIYSQNVWQNGVYTPKDLLASTVPVTFDLDIRPPNLIFVSPPSVIERRDAEPKAGYPIELLPKEHTLEFLIEFPDQLQRPLISTTLYVDDAQVAQNTEQPFDRFQWNLTGYLESTKHVVKVEAVDNLGLIGTSIDLPISIVVNRQPRSLISVFTNRIHLLVGLVGTILGSVLFLVLILGRRIRPKVFGFAKGIQVYRTPKNRFSDSQVEKTQQDQSSIKLPGWINPLYWAQKATTGKANAYLTCRTENDRQKMIAPLPLSSDEVSLGRDPHKSILVLDDPSIDALHARILREGDRYRIVDEDTIAGTWVNYTLVSNEGMFLEHGDLVNIGRMAFWFMLQKPIHQHKPVILPEELYK